MQRIRRSGPFALVSDLFAVAPYKLFVLLDRHAATPSGKSCASLAGSFSGVMMAPRRIRRICPEAYSPDSVLFCPSERCIISFGLSALAHPRAGGFQQASFQVLVFGCAYRRIAVDSCSATTLGDRPDEWIACGVIEKLCQIALDAYDRLRLAFSWLRWPWMAALQKLLVGREGWQKPSG